jgi:hypothetical protein
MRYNNVRGNKEVNMIKNIRTQIGRKKDYSIHMERFESVAEMVAVNNKREMTSSSFNNVRADIDGSWSGVKSFSDAEQLLINGYQPTVEAMRGVWKGKAGTVGRFKFENQIAGFAPIVPLALKGVPNCMLNMSMKPMKAKVLDVYYDITVACRVSSGDIIKLGQSILGSIIELEREGYRFNLYGVQTYSDSNSCDMLVVKLKSASQPLDLKRVSFPLTHTAFFRVFGFDWYSRVPNGKYRSGYGHAMGYDFSIEDLSEMAQQVLSKNWVYIVASEMVGEDKDKIKEVIVNANSKEM